MFSPLRRIAGRRTPAVVVKHTSQQTNTAPGRIAGRRPSPGHRFLDLLGSRSGLPLWGAALLGLLATATASAAANLPVPVPVPGAKPEAPPQTVALIVAALILGTLILKVAAVAAATLAAALAPHRTASVERRVAARPGRLFLVGLADAVALLALVAVVGGIAKRVPALNLVLLALIVAEVCLALLGLAGVYAAIGRRLGAGGVSRAGGTRYAEDAGGPDGAGGTSGVLREASPGNVLRGGALFETATLFPLVGCLASVVVLCIALGGASLTLLEKRAVPSAPDEPVT